MDEIYDDFHIATHVIRYVCGNCNADKTGIIRIREINGMASLIIEIILWVLKITLVLSVMGLCGNAFENKIVATVVAIGILSLSIMLFHAIDGDFKKEKIMENERIKYINTEVYKKPM